MPSESIFGAAKVRKVVSTNKRRLALHRSRRGSSAGAVLQENDSDTTNFKQFMYICGLYMTYAETN